MNTSVTRNFRQWVRNGNWKKMLVTTALPAMLLTLGAGHALAQVGGQDTNGNVGIPAGGCITLNQQILPAATFLRYCAVTGSADVFHPVGNGLYTFNLTLDQPVATACNPLDGGKERTVQFFDTPVGGVIVRDSRIKEVTSTGFFRLAAGVAHILRWTGRATGSPATLVADRSLSVVCSNLSLPPSPIP